ncbi:MAG: hypothetical protein ABIZ69_11670 [Ilumatobacteraceae bacterium]
MSFTEGPLHERSDVVYQEPVAAVVDVPVDGQVVVPAAAVGVPAAPVAVPAAPVVVQAAPVATAGQVRTAYASRFAPDAIIAGIAGLVIMVVGLIAIVRGGFDGPMSDPVVQVVGFTHTTLLGLIEIGIGGALLLSAATRSRSGEVFFGAVLGIAGFVGAVQTTSFKKSLALESSMAWIAVFIGVVVVLAALMLPRYNRQSTVIEHL